MLVNIYTKEGNVIKKCNIYPEDVKQGDLPYSTKEQIDNALGKVPWGFKFISFQTENIHGKIHVNNIEKYEIHNIELKLGDRVKVIDFTSEHCFEKDELVTLIEVFQNSDEPTTFTCSNGDIAQDLYSEDFELI